MHHPRCMEDQSPLDLGSNPALLRYAGSRISTAPASGGETKAILTHPLSVRRASMCATFIPL